MPELPEVEHIVRYLRPRVVGRSFRSVERCEGTRLLTGATTTPAALGRALRGRRIEAVGRLAKLVLIRLDDGATLAVHLKMTGCLWAEPPGGHEHGRSTRALFLLEGSEEEASGKARRKAKGKREPSGKREEKGARGGPVELAFEDQRKLGWIARLDEAALEAIRARTGPDALLASEGAIARALGAQRGRVKPALLDQEVLAGVGNIYADEILHRARVHPETRLDALEPAKLRAVARAVKHVIARAVADRDGIDVPDQERVGSGRKGVAERRLRLEVYQRAGKPCGRCKEMITRIVVGGRGTYLCPRCQRRKQWNRGMSELRN